MKCVWAFLASGLLIGTLASANTEQIIQSVVDGQRPYMLVTADQEGASKREAGIYNADEKGGWHVMIAGNPLTGAATQGLVAQLKLSELDRRYETVAIVDGKIHIFQMLSKRDDPKTFLKLGGPEAPAIDVMSNMQVAIPDVKRLEDFVVLPLAHSNAGQLVLFSVRGISPMGDGVTFAAYVKAASKAAEGALELSGPLFVLDYKFQTFDQLSKLECPSAKGQGVYSRSLLNAYLRKRSNDEPPGLSGWRTTLKEFLGLLDTPERAATANSRVMSVPYYDIPGETVRISQPPLVAVNSGNLAAIQVYDPVSNQDGIIFGTAANPITPSMYHLRGRVDFNFEKKAYRIYPSMTERQANLAYINKELFLLLGNGTETANIRIDGAGEFPDTIDFHIVTPPPLDGKKQYYILLSSVRNAVKKTEVIVVDALSGSYHISKRVPFLAEFYTQKEMIERTVVFGSDVLFDNITPHQEREGSYGQVAKDTAPYLNLTAVRDQWNPIQTYRKAVEDKAITDSNRIRYRVFDAVGATAVQTGLFFLDRESKNTAKTVVGELLKLRSELKPKETEDYVAATRTIAPSGEGAYGKVSVSVVALDQSFMHGEQNFRMLTLVEPYGDSSKDSYFDPVIRDNPISVPFDRVTSVQVWTGKKKHANEVIVLYIIDPPPAGSRAAATEKGGILLDSFAIKYDKNKGADIQVLDQRKIWLTSEKAAPADVANRIKFSSEGDIFWVDTPEVDPIDKNYRLVSLYNGNQLLPNVGKKQVKILSGEEVRKNRTFGDGEDEYGEYGYTPKNSWDVYSKYSDSLTRIFKKESLEKEIEASKKRLFPMFEQTLDELADAKVPPRHEIILVSPEMKETLKEFIANALMQRKAGSPFYFDSRNLKFYIFDPNKANQADVFDNLEKLKTLPSGTRGMIFADMAEINTIDRPKPESEEKTFRISDPEIPEQDRKEIEPHLLYLMGWEGETIGLEESKRKSTWANRLSMVIIATPDEWATAQEQLDPESKYGILDRFKINATNLAGPWKIIPPDTFKADKETKQLQEQPVSQLEQQVFPNLVSSLNDLADLKAPAKHKVLLISDDLKSSIRRMILSRWASASKDLESSIWNYHNHKLDLYRFNAANLNQQTIFANFDAMRASSGDKRAVILAELSEIKKSARPTNAPNSTPFFIEDWVSKGQVFGQETGAPNPNGVDQNANEGKKLPHSLYLFATEGRELQPKEFEEVKGQPNQVSSLFVGSKQEWESILKDLSVENILDLGKQFEIVELTAPSAEIRKKLLLQTVQRQEIQSLGYRFDAFAINRMNNSQEDARDKLMDYMVSRAAALAKQQKQEVTSAYIKVLTEFSKALIEDQTLRSSKVIDLHFVERLISKSFAIPLNLKILPPNDPLKRLADVNKAAIDLQNAGYKGRLELKFEFLKAILSQTRNDPARQIPSSIVIFGETRSGKTFFYDTLIKMLGLQLYDFDKPMEQEAQAFKINAATITEDKSSDSSETHSVDEVIANLQNFLALPNGYRGFILIDDLHKAGPKVLQKLLPYLQSLMEAKDGVVRVKTIGVFREVREISVRNLTLFVTMNPTSDQDKLKKIGPERTPVDIAVATLSSKEYEVEKSLFSRFGAFIPLNKFPVEAKGPKLLETIRDSARSDFSIQGRLTLVSPAAVNSVVMKFPDLNASEFLSEATSQLLTVQGQEVDSKGGQVYVVVPAAAAGIRPARAQSPDGGFEHDQPADSGSAIEKFVRQEIVAVPVDQRVGGQFQLLHMMVDTFRTNLYSALVGAATEDMRIAGTPENRENILAPFLHGVMGTMGWKSFIPLNALRLDPYDFKARTPTQLEEFRRVMDAMGGHERFLPIKFADEFGSEDLVGKITDHMNTSQRERNRADVLLAVSEKAHELEFAYLQEMLRVKSLLSLPDPKAWLLDLKEQEVEAANVVVGKKLSELFLNYMQEMYSRGLVENREADKFKEMTTLDLVRLFLLAVDRGITKLPWGPAVQFMTKGLTLAASDMEVGQRPGVQFYLFDSETSLARPVTHERLFQMAYSSEAYRQWPEEMKTRLNSRFISDCQKFLVQE